MDEDLMEHAPKFKNFSQKTRLLSDIALSAAAPLSGPVFEKLLDQIALRAGIDRDYLGACAKNNPAKLEILRIITARIPFGKISAICSIPMIDAVDADPASATD